MNPNYQQLPQASLRISKPRLMATFALLAGLLFWLQPSSVQAQVTLTCPPNVMMNADSGACSATITYSDPTTNAMGMQSDTFFFTGTAQTLTIPPGNTSISVELWGAEGANSVDRLPGNATGGLGGYVSGDLAVMPGQVLNIYVGGQGDSLIGTGGYNGGGNGGTGSAGSSCPGGSAGGGGGASDLRLGGTTLADRVAVAAGGGGAGRDYCNGTCQPCGCGGGGGGAGGTTGTNGSFGYNCGFGYAGQSINFGGGATAMAGGAGGPQDGGSTNIGLPGVLGAGGVGSSGTQGVSGGGGGGGFYGGGGGGASNGSGVAGGGGGGGSSYTAGLTNVSNQSGIASGNGMVIVTYIAGAAIQQTAGLPSGATYTGGVTTNAFLVVDGQDSATCSFTVTINDVVNPIISCPGAQGLVTDANCTVTVPDYTALATASDNCDANPSIAQAPMAGSALTGAPTTQTVLLTVSDSTGNMDTCSFTLSLTDTIAPTFTNCPSNIDFTPTMLDCNPVVNFTAPSENDACGASVSSTHAPGDNFPVGATAVVYTATDSSGNTATCTFTVTVNNPQIDNMITVTPGDSVCEGDTITLTATPGLTYNWSIGPTTQSIITLAGGTYWVDLTDGNCTARDSVEIVVSPTPAPAIVQNGQDLCTGTFATYQWFMNGTAISGANSACFTPQMDGNYTVMVTQGNCDGTSPVFMLVGADEALVSGQFSMFPNPARDALNIKMAEPLNIPGEIKLYDLTGRIVMTKAFRSLNGVETLSLNALPGGTYIVEIAAKSLLTRRTVVHLD